MKLSKNKILITGGSAGIGRALAARFLQEGNTVIVCGRSQQALDETRRLHPGLLTRACDCSDAAQREALFSWVRAEHNDLDVLVNNAGIQQWMHPQDEDFWSRAQEEIRINLEAPVHLTWLFLRLPSLKTVVNVSSGLAFTPLTRVPVYSATKSFIRSFTLSLRHLVRERGIEVIELIPPALNTDLGGKGLHDHAPPVSDFIASAFDQLREGRTQITWGFSEAMANAAPDALRQAFDRMNGGS